MIKVSIVTHLGTR